MIEALLHLNRHYDSLSPGVRFLTFIAIIELIAFFPPDRLKVVFLLGLICLRVIYFVVAINESP